MSQVKTHLSSQTRMEPFKGLPQVTSQSQALVLVAYRGLSNNLFPGRDDLIFNNGY